MDSKILPMAIGQKLFEEVGKIAGFKVIKVHPIEGVTTEVSFMSDIKGIEISKWQKSCFRYND